MVPATGRQSEDMSASATSDELYKSYDALWAAVPIL